MEGSHIKLLFFSLLFIFFPSISTAFSEIEKDLQEDLEKDRIVIKKAKERHKRGEHINNEVIRLKSDAGRIKASHILLQEKFRLQEEEIKGLGPKALERQRAMYEGYKKAIDEYLSLIDNLPPPGQVSGDDIEKIETHLDKILHKKKVPIFGSLPYKNLSYPSREPSSDPPIKPAYKGGNKTVSPDDLKSTIEAPVSQEIASLAQVLNWNPVSIYEYVKNNIETEWYWGCMKGAEETLYQKSGNDCDQAALLLALLRASGFPSRYVRGTIEFFAGGRDGVPMEKVKNITGIDDPWNIAEFFQKSGIPFKPIIIGGTISNFQIEHIWVESQIPYANYRGAIIDERGKTWLGLDTSIKPKGYIYSSPIDIFQQAAVRTQLSSMREEYLTAIHEETPLEYLRSFINTQLANSQPATRYDDILRTRTLAPEIMNILPASMQFNQKKITHEYAEIPDELKHKIKFIAADFSGSELLNFEVSTMELSNRQIALSYEPDSVEDQQIIDSYGGLDNTPAYLVRLRPVLKVDGERVAVGLNGLPMGADYNLTIEFMSPNGTEKVSGTHITGNLSTMAIVSQRPLKPQEIPFEEKDAERLLYEEAINYIDRWNQAEDELASLLHLSVSRPIATVTTIGGVIDVTYLLDLPYGYEWKGVFLDASLRAASPVASYVSVATGEREKAFMQLSALQGSILENRIFEDDFQVESISTAKLFQIVNSQPPTEILTIDRTNVDAILPTLSLDGDIEEVISNSVNQNLTIRIPTQEITYRDWIGIGYIKENPGTGEAGYMLSGMIAGGMTAVSPDKWSNQALRMKLGRPYVSGTKAITITAPKNGEVLYQPFVTVTGTILDPKGAVTVNGVAAVIDGNTFTANIPLSLGNNAITASTSNSFGVRVTDTVSVTYKIPIAVIITFPYDGGSLSVSPIDVEGILSDPAATVNVNGIRGIVSNDGRFIAKGISLVQGANQLTAKAASSDGTTGSQTITVNYQSAPVSPMSISITYPANNSTINRPSTMVRGTITTNAQEISIKINGFAADIYGNQFVVNNVPLSDGDSVIIANAVDSNGAMGRAEVSVKVDTTQPYITLSANITSGIPPLTTYFSVSTNTPNPVVSYRMDFEGRGGVGYTGDTFEGVNFTYATEGIYYPTITVTDDQGNTYTDSMAITVLNKAAIDALLKAKWEKVKAALAKGDIESALSLFRVRAKDRYRAIFNALKDQLPAIVQTFVEFNIVNVYEIIGEYEIVANENGKLYSYPGVFIRGSDGIWKFNDF